VWKFSGQAGEYLLACGSFSDRMSEKSSAREAQKNKKKKKSTVLSVEGEVPV